MIAWRMDRFDDAGTDAEQCERILLRNRSDRNASEDEDGGCVEISIKKERRGGELLLEGKMVASW